MTSTSLLTSARIRLRALELIDAPKLHEWEHRSDAWSSSDILNPVSPSFFSQLAHSSGKELQEHSSLYLLIERTDTGESVGYVQLANYSATDGRLSLGIYVEHGVRRMGIAEEALSLCESYAYLTLNIRMLYAQVLESNAAACQLFHKLGYHHTATLPQWMWTDGAYHSLRYYQKWRN